MSPVKRKERLIHIDQNRFRKAIADRGVSQKEIAFNVIHTSEAYFSRKLSSGIIDKDWLYEIADYLDVSRSFLTGESDVYITRLAERRNEISASDAKVMLTEFMISRGYPDHYCDDLNDTDLNNIEEFISGVVTTHEDIIGNTFDYGLALEQRIAELEKRIKVLEDNNSH